MSSPCRRRGLLFGRIFRNIPRPKLSAGAADVGAHAAAEGRGNALRFQRLQKFAGVALLGGLEIPLPHRVEEETDDSVSASAPDASPTDASLPVRDTDGTAAVPANNVVVSGDGGPYDQRLESGGRVTVAEDVYAAPGNIVAFGITTRTDAVLTVGLRCGEDDISQRVELEAGKLKMATFYPEKAGAYELYLANPGGYGEDFNVSWALC